MIQKPLNWRMRLIFWICQKRYRLTILRILWYIWALPWFIVYEIGKGLIWLSRFAAHGKEDADETIKGL